MNHDKLKPAYSRETIDTSWVFEKPSGKSKELKPEESELVDLCEDFQTDVIEEINSSSSSERPQRQNIKPPNRYGEWYLH